MAMRPPRGGGFQPRPSMRPPYERPSMRPTYERLSMRPPYARPSMRPTFERPSMRPTYESFRPKAEWKHEDNDTILLLYLPGFLREQIKIDLDKSRGLIQIQGQRFLGAGRWSTFNQSFKIPPACDLTKMDKRFELGVLTIIMPNLTTPNQNVTTTTTPPPTPLDGAIVDDKNLDSLTEETEETSSDDDYELYDLEKFDGKKEDKKANIIPDEKLSKAEKKDHMMKKGDAEEKVKAKYMEHESDVVEKKTMKSEERVLLINMVIAAVVLMGLGAHIFSIFGTSKTP